MAGEGLFFNRMIIGLGILLGLVMHLWMWYNGLPQDQVKVHAIINIVIFAYAGIYLWTTGFFK